MGKLFPDKVVYDDRKDICTMLFAALLFEDRSGKMTPLAYFVEHAVLADAEKQLCEAWRDHTRYGFFVVQKIVPGKEVHLSDLAGRNRYCVYEAKGRARMQNGMVIIAHIVPFLKGWRLPRRWCLRGQAARHGSMCGISMARGFRSLLLRRNTSWNKTGEWPSETVHNPLETAFKGCEHHAPNRP